MRSTLLALCLALSSSPSVFAAQVLAEEPDTTAGKAAGGITGLMVGAVGGPIGAIAGAALGYFGGSAVQQSSGLSEAAYQVRTDDGSVQRFRSPNARFAVGDEVQVQGIRLVPAGS